MQREQSADQHRAGKSQNIAGKGVGAIDAGQVPAEQNQCCQRQIDPAARHAQATADRKQPSEFHQGNIGNRHQRGARQREPWIVAEDQRQQIEPLADTMDIAEGAQHRPRQSLLRPARHREGCRPQ